MTTQFLADCPNDELIEYDILSKHRQEWVNANPQRKREIIAEARKKGKIGWNIGVSSKIIQNAPRLTDQRAVSGEIDRRGPLSNAHIRTGHLHCVRCGEGRKDVKVMWFRPTVVRSDLPFRQEELA
jgi:hypothetical protein